MIKNNKFSLRRKVLPILIYLIFRHQKEKFQWLIWTGPEDVPNTNNRGGQDEDEDQQQPFSNHEVFEV